jgi:hypothetical protein
VPLRLYADECVDGRIVAGLIRRGVDIVTAGSLGLLGATDDQQLARAVELGRVAVSSDHDFLRLAHERIGAGAPFPGLIFILPGARVGEIVRAVALAADALDPADVAGCIEWVP